MKGVERFVTDGYGAWRRMVFANQAALIGHKSEPAGVRGLASVAEAIGRIAEKKAPFVQNDIPGVDYLLSPRIQAQIAALRKPGSDLQLWWPAGRNN